jgi:hypothetical protein
MSDEQKMREAFEKWMFDGKPDFAAANRDKDGIYTWTAALWAWKGWQAAQAEAAEEIAALKSQVAEYKKWISGIQMIRGEDDYLVNDACNEALSAAEKECAK